MHDKKQPCNFSAQILQRKIAIGEERCNVLVQYYLILSWKLLFFHTVVFSS